MPTPEQEPSVLGLLGGGLSQITQPAQPGGLAGLAVNLQGQSGQPQGLAQALGAGLLGASAFGQSATQQAFEDPNAGFNEVFASGLLGSIGAPARAAAAQEQDRQQKLQQMQTALLEKSFEKLTPESKQEVLGEFGIQGLEFKPELGPIEERTVEFAFDRLGDENVPPEEKQNLLLQMQDTYPDATKVLFGTEFEETPFEVSSAMLSAVRQAFTAESFRNVLLDKKHDDFMNFGALVPQSDAEFKIRSLSPRDLDAVMKRLEVLQTRDRLNTTEDQSEDIVFAGDATGRSNYDRYYGKAVGPITDPTALAYKLMDNFFLSALQHPQAQLGAVAAMADSVAAIQRPPGPRAPQAEKRIIPRGPLSNATPNETAVLAAMLALGVPGAENIETRTELSVRADQLEANNPVLAQELEKLAKQIAADPSIVTTPGPLGLGLGEQ
jgi:flagellar motor protein MotB